MSDARRLAWFTPWAPVQSGISAYSAELLPELRDDFAIDIFVDRPVARATPGVITADDFLWRHRHTPYDLIVYQLGNAACHDFMWPYMVRFPGLVVMHDAGLHHARARALLTRGRMDDYRAEFAFDRPTIDPGAAEFAINGLTGFLYYLWPMRRVVMTAARAVAVHSAELARELSTDFPDTPVYHIRMGVGAVPEPPADRDRDDGVQIATLGLVTPEKRIDEILTALVPLVELHPATRLTLVGPTVDYYDPLESARRLGIASHVTVTGYVDDASVEAWLHRADLVVCLRWPTAGETSASWLRAIAAGNATIVADLAHTVDVPTLDPRSWRLNYANRHAQPGIGPDDAIAVSIDIMDEEHSLSLALERLIADGDLRRRLGRNARQWWSRHHTLAAMAADYRHAIALAAGESPQPRRHALLPPHLSSSCEETLQRVVAEMGIDHVFPALDGARAVLTSTHPDATLDLDRP